MFGSGKITDGWVYTKDGWVYTTITTNNTSLDFNDIGRWGLGLEEPRRIFKCDRGHRYETCDRWQPPIYLGGKCWKCWDEALGNVEEVKECSC